MMSDELDTRVRARISKRNATFLDHRSNVTGKTKSRLIEEALAASFSYEIDDIRDAKIIESLDLIERHNHRLARDLNLHMESFALFLQFFFTMSPQIAAEDSDARASKGVKLLNHFIDQLGGKMKKGGKTFKHALSDVLVSDDDFFRRDELKLLKSLKAKRLTPGDDDE